mmetsp:Transcript_31894/g.95492  ORF Transcript_31894/g.95492 Transcript_31894/m.95492 type:complete len:382 (+) Transcript_31894:577-1722(+)
MRGAPGGTFWSTSIRQSDRAWRSRIISPPFPMTRPTYKWETSPFSSTVASPDELLANATGVTTVAAAGGWAGAGCACGAGTPWGMPCRKAGARAATGVGCAVAVGTPGGAAAGAGATMGAGAAAAGAAAGADAGAAWTGAGAGAGVSTLFSPGLLTGPGLCPGFPPPSAAAAGPGLLPTSSASDFFSSATPTGPGLFPGLPPPGFPLAFSVVDLASSNFFSSATVGAGAGFSGSTFFSSAEPGFSAAPGTSPGLAAARVSSFASAAGAGLSTGFASTVGVLGSSFGEVASFFDDSVSIGFGSSSSSSVSASPPPFSSISFFSSDLAILAGGSGACREISDGDMAATAPARSKRGGVAMVGGIGQQVNELNDRWARFKSWKK